MDKYFHAMNGIGYDKDGMDGTILNAHISYKGRSVIVDYEHCLHPYGHLADYDGNEKFVPFEFYPYGDDIYVGYVPLDEKFGKADISELMKLIDEALENEPEPFDWSASDDEAWNE